MTTTSNKNLSTDSEMERQVLRSLIVFLERVQFLFSSLFAEILISTLYYSRRTPPLLHLLCVIRPHLLLSAFHYVFFFLFSFSDLGLFSRFVPVVKLYLLC
jgi:hypothetical protein